MMLKQAHITYILKDKYPNRRNQISTILTDLQCIIGNLSQVCGSARTIIVQFRGQYPGTSPSMHRESANMADI